MQLCVVDVLSTSRRLLQCGTFFVKILCILNYRQSDLFQRLLNRLRQEVLFIITHHPIIQTPSSGKLVLHEKYFLTFLQLIN